MQKVSRDFHSFYEKKQSECTSDTCSLYTSGVAFCCVLAFALLMYIWSKNIHPYAIVH